MEIYVLAGEDRHLTICRQCRVRFDELVRALQHMREDGIREADSIFTSERLHDQRDRVMRRLERQGQPAEVVMFPSRSASQPAVRILGPARRWVAGAAAAGLAAGLFLGFVMDRRTDYAAGASAMRTSAPAAAWQATTARDDQFFTELDAALMGSRAVGLRAIDTMTTPVEIREAGYPR
ncbi:MAG TPA: hypothetical protein VJM31_05865 [Vicinamibacterales bacterium]|nr:hypothetical protein [Vicinamibacterales bacterium]